MTTPTTMTCNPLILVILLAFALPALADERLQFNRDIRPILSDKCFPCHGPDAQKREADLRLDRRDAAIGTGAIQPAKPDESELIRRVISQDPDERMPPASAKLGTLSASEIQTLRRWIEEGADYEGHWSFLPIRRSELPEKGVTAGTGVADGIDALIRDRLAKRGLAMQPEADRYTLIRRVSFDLIGLPPSPEAIEAFVSDRTENAYERLVDGLLQSDQFGERMAVDWLDTARYADSYGFQVDRERETWPWRDWVIRAFNANLPFDQFIIWQIAGDLLPDPSDDQILATAFNRLHQQESEGGSVEEEYRVEYVCDRVQTFATAFLGLTFECARCHDHKYDPITQKEYYQLFAMFQNIDEAGLYSYFTPSPPTPTLLLADDGAKRQMAMLRAKVDEVERRGGEIRESRGEAFRRWLETKDPSREIAKWLDPVALRELGRFEFEAVDQGKLANGVKADQPATLRGDNQLVPGRHGHAVRLTGDDPIELPFGNFSRHEPFSISLWMQTPDTKERAVVLHRSRAWTDAASRGYEVLIENGKLKWSLIHFWPGNAISIASRTVLPHNEWVHVVVASDGGSRAAGLRLYVNGTQAPVDVVRDSLSKEITGGGGDNITLGERFRDRGFTNGLVDDLRVFGRELSAAEVTGIFDESMLKQLLAKPVAELNDGERTLLLDGYLAASDGEWSKHLADLQAARGEWTKFVDGIKEIMVMRELPQPKKSYVLFRGEYAQRRDEVQAGVPAALSPFPDGAPRNRLGLARWLTDRNHPLTSRVTVNRIWQSLFGRGLVRTAEDFGSQGAKPVYPDVLDWLAWHFMEGGWDTKQLVKSIVMSATYRQRSVALPQLMADDPDNEWLARGPRFRLPAEMIRDNALAAAGLLKQSLGGPPVQPYEMSEAFKPAAPSTGDGVHRRSIYTHWRRTGPPPAMVAFDAPRRAVCIAKRERTDSPLQALILLNGIQYVEAARVLGESLHRNTQGDPAKMIEQGFLRCLSRRPDAREMVILGRLYREQLAHFSQHRQDADELLKVGQAPRDGSISLEAAAAATILAQALLNHDACVVKR